MLFVHSAVCLQDGSRLTAVYNYAGLIVIIIKWLHRSFSLSLTLSPSRGCCFGCFDINVTMTPPFSLEKTLPSCNGFWEHEPATAASDMPDFSLSPLQSGFSYTMPPFSLQLFSFTLIFCSFFFLNYLLCTPVAPALFVSCSFTFPPSYPPSPSASPTPPRRRLSPCSGVLALVVVKAALP